jgi:hypothetical protein
MTVIFTGTVIDFLEGSDDTVGVKVEAVGVKVKDVGDFVEMGLLVEENGLYEESFDGLF